MGRALRRTLQVKEVIMRETALATISVFAPHKKICLVLSLLLLSAIPVEAKATPPNILFIVADNQLASNC
jgi:hypothetical protein